MKIVCRIAILLSFVSLLGASLALAKPKEQSAEIRIAFVTKLTDAELQPGTYKVVLMNEAQNPQIAFYRGNKLVCKCPVKLEDAGKKIPQTKVQYVGGPGNTHMISSIAIGGWTQTMVLNHPSS